MPVLVVFRTADVSLEEYDRIMQVLGSAETPQPGSVAHFAGLASDGALVVVDVWETTQHFHAFRTGKLEPAFAQVLGQQRAARLSAEVIETHAAMATDLVERVKLAPAG